MPRLFFCLWFSLGSQTAHSFCLETTPSSYGPSPPKMGQVKLSNMCIHSFWVFTVNMKFIYQKPTLEQKLETLCQPASPSPNIPKYRLLRIRRQDAIQTIWCKLVTIHSITWQKNTILNPSFQTSCCWQKFINEMAEISNLTKEKKLTSNLRVIDFYLETLCNETLIWTLILVKLLP